MSVEILLLSVNLNFILFSILLDDLWGQLFAIYILAVAAAESAIGLVIFVLYFNNKQTIAIEKNSRSKG